MEDRFLQQLKKGALEMLVLELLCAAPGYGYELIAQLKTRSNGLLTVPEGTLYPILYRLEDDGLIEAAWTQGKGRSAPKKIYAPTPRGLAECGRRRRVWRDFSACVDGFLKEES